MSTDKFEPQALGLIKEEKVEMASLPKNVQEDIIKLKTFKDGEETNYEEWEELDEKVFNAVSDFLESAPAPAEPKAEPKKEEKVEEPKPAEVKAPDAKSAETPKTDPPAKAPESPSDFPTAEPKKEPVKKESSFWDRRFGRE